MDLSIWNSGDLSPLISQAIWENKSHKWNKKQNLSDLGPMVPRVIIKVKSLKNN
jgi:hypothetical protein